MFLYKIPVSISLYLSLYLSILYKNVCVDMYIHTYAYVYIFCVTNHPKAQWYTKVSIYFLFMCLQVVWGSFDLNWPWRQLYVNFVYSVFLQILRTVAK